MPKRNVQHPANVACGFGPLWFRMLLCGCAVLYMAAVWLNGAGSSLPQTSMHPVPRYFAQIACLFPKAALMSIEYRAEAWSCQEQRFMELDVRPYFPIRKDDKESRFHRALHFLRRDRPSMQALERYIIRRHNETAGPESSPMPPIGGVRFWSVRIPFPKLGETMPRWTFQGLNDYPPDQRKAWYWTPQSRRHDYCVAAPLLPFP